MTDHIWLALYTYLIIALAVFIIMVIRAPRQLDNGAVMGGAAIGGLIWPLTMFIWLVAAFGG